MQLNRKKELQIADQSGWGVVAKLKRFDNSDFSNRKRSKNWRKPKRASKPGRRNSAVPAPVLKKAKRLRMRQAPAGRRLLGRRTQHDSTPEALENLSCKYQR